MVESATLAVHSVLANAGLSEWQLHRLLTFYLQSCESPSPPRLEREHELLPPSIYTSLVASLTGACLLQVQG